MIVVVVCGCWVISGFVCLGDLAAGFCFWVWWDILLLCGLGFVVYFDLVRFNVCVVFDGFLVLEWLVLWGCMFWIPLVWV